KARSKDLQADGIDRYVGLEHLEPGDLKIRSWGDVADGTTFTSVFRPGQVLFGKRRAYQRKLAVADFTGVCSGDVYVFEPSGELLLSEFLPYLCQSESFFEYAVKTSAGSLSPRTNWTHLAQYEFDLPPLEEQTKLVRSLIQAEVHQDALFRLGAATQTLLQSAVEETIWQSSYPRRPLAEIADAEWGAFRDGDWIETKDQSETGIRLLQLADIGTGTFLDQSSRFISDKTFDQLRCTEVLPGDLLIARMAEPIGRTCLIPELAGRAIAAVDCCIARIDLSQQSRLFWLLALNTPSWTAEVLKLSAGSTRVRISRSNLESIKVPCPSHEEQEHIVEALWSIQSSVSWIQSRKNQAHLLSSRILMGGWPDAR
ncbi:MAG: hypothetical protein HOL45_02405, partial [Chloroflexi bacterium]|nr:hypothetical protein [Chloroflexota bacterium]